MSADRSCDRVTDESTPDRGSDAIRACEGAGSSSSVDPSTMSVIDRFPHSTAELRRVKAVQFGVLSPDEIVRTPPAPISSRLRADSRNDSLGLPPRARRVPDLS
jgi:hypothetical protein